MIPDLHISMHGKSMKVFSAVAMLLVVTVGIGFSSWQSNRNADASPSAHPRVVNAGPVSSRPAAFGSIDLSKAPKIPSTGNSQHSSKGVRTNRPVANNVRAQLAGVSHSVPRVVTTNTPPSAVTPKFVGGGLGPALGVKGDGLNSIQGGGGYPPDQAIAVGGGNSLSTNFVVEGVNDAFAIYNDNLAVVAGPYTPDTLFASVKLNGDFFSDPQITVDTTRVHWVFAWLELTPSSSTATGVSAAYIDIAVSKTISPIGIPSNYYVYRFSTNTGANDFCDYPTLGMSYWNMYISCAQFGTDNSGQGNRVFVFNKTDLYAGSGSVHNTYYSNIPSSVNCATACVPAYRLTPAIEDGAPSAEWIIATDAGYGTSQNLTLCAVTAEYGLTSGAKPYMTCIMGNLPGAYADFVPAVQPGTNITLDPGQGTKQIMYKGGRLWFAMTTGVNWNGDTTTRDGIYWAEVQPFLGSFAAHNPPQVSGFNTIQQSYWGYVGVYTYMGTLFPSDEGDASLVFNYSNSSTYPSILYTGRMADDALNTLGQGQSYWVVGGTHSNSGGASIGQMGRWGDYSACSLNIQPTERAQLYCAGEYGGSLASTTDVGWNTYIYSLRME